MNTKVTSGSGDRADTTRYRKKTILIVDDVPANIQILDEILREEYVIKAAMNGKAAISIAEKEIPDLILLDVLMPDMDGLEVCRQLKSRKKLANIPVIFVSALGETCNEDAGFKAGCVDYIVKPITPMIVQSRVRTHLQLQEHNRELERLVEERTTRLKQEMVKTAGALDSLAEAYNLLNNVMESFVGGVVAINADGQITFANRGMEWLAGAKSDEILGRTLYEIFPDSNDALRGAFEDALNNKKTTSLELYKKNSEGRSAVLGASIFPLRGSGNIRGAVFGIQDITKKKMIESQLLQASKMATLGELAAGVAHEINQPLNVIRMTAQMLKEVAEDPEDSLDERFLRENAERSLGMVERISRLVNQLRDFGRKTDGEFLNIAAERPVEDAISLLREKLQMNAVQMRLDNPGNLPQVYGEPGSLEQVFINFLSNSMDAMEDVHEKVIEVSIRYRSDNQRVEYRLSDNGPGIPPDKLDRIFDTFFT
ncbi:MAG: response regulator, partial [Leptospiraceae bacterium]|nr:response regulator [Leptospiraceae bacterium]